MKFKLRGYHFDTMEEIQGHRWLNEWYFQRVLQMWQERWEWCITAECDYSDGNCGQIQIQVHFLLVIVSELSDHTLYLYVFG